MRNRPRDKRGRYLNELSDERKMKILGWYKQGLTWEQIRVRMMSEFLISQSTAYKWFEQVLKEYPF